MSRILVTGGTGFIGSALVRRLTRHGHSVRVLDDGSRGSDRRLADIRDDVELVKGDVRDAEVVQRACVGVDAVFHLAAVNGTENFYRIPYVVLDVAARGMLNVLAAIAESGTELFVASSSEVYQTPPHVPTDETAPLSIPDPLNPRYSYAGGKMISELLALNLGGEHSGRVIVFRPHNVYGSDMGWEHVIPQLALRVHDALDQPDPLSIRIQGTGDETRAFMHVDDLIEGLMILYAKGEHRNIYHIGNDIETSVRMLVEETGRCFGREVRIESGPLQPGSTTRRCPDITKLRRLGFSPKIDLREGLASTVRWYHSHAHERPSPSTN